MGFQRKKNIADVFIDVSCVIAILACFVNLGRCTFDLNIHELQFVADHLTALECRKVVEALHETEFFLSHNVTGQHEPDVSCIDLLVTWNDGEGKNESVVDLSLRLKELGHKELAGKLTRKVFHEKVEKVQRDFLLDPFKELIHTNSPLLEESAMFLGGTKKEAVEVESSTKGPASNVLSVFKSTKITAILSAVSAGILILLITFSVMYCKKRKSSKWVDIEADTKPPRRAHSMPEVAYRKLQTL